jgi:membrane-associated phospholipid phosphatase
MPVDNKLKEKRRIAEPITRVTQHPLFLHFRLVDYLTVFYLVFVAVLILPFQHRVDHVWVFSVLNVAVACLLTFFIGFCAERPSARILQVLRSSYPLLLYTFMFLEISQLIPVFFPFWLENYLIAWDLALFGVYPPVWVQQFFRPWLSEFMAFAYWSYYLIFPLCAILLYNRENKNLFHSYVFSLSVTFYACYISYPFLTARGPHDTLEHLYLTREIAGFFDATVRNMQERAAISGAAFPSSHVAATWIVWIYLYKFRRALGWLTLPLILSLCFSVVYMQYHYAVDSVAGCVWVVLTYTFARYVENKVGPAGIPLSFRYKQSNNHKKA